MKAAFLLTAAAWVSAAQAAPDAAAPPTAAAVAPAPAVATPAPASGAPLSVVTVPGGPIVSTPTGACHGPDCGGAAIVTSSCDCCETKPSFRERLRARCSSMFSRNKSCDCCDMTTGPLAPHALPSGPGGAAFPGTIQTVPGSMTPEPIQKPMVEPGSPMPKTQLMPPAVELAPTSSRLIEPENQHPF